MKNYYCTKNICPDCTADFNEGLTVNEIMELHEMFPPERATEMLYELDCLEAFKEHKSTITEEEINKVVDKIFKCIRKHREL